MFKDNRRNICSVIVISGIVLGAGLALGGCQATSHDPSTESAQRDINLWPKTASPVVGQADDSAFVENILSKMTVEEKVGQILQAEIQSVTPADIKKYHLGSVLNGGGSVPKRNNSATAKDWVALADEFYNASMDTSDGGVAIPVIWGTDAVHGHNNLRGATIFPHNMGLGATHNPDLIRRIGEATAKEVRASGINWVFAPTLAAAQNDLWGRTYESYSENPTVIAQFAAAMVNGLQGTVGTPEFLSDDHVLACAKHFLADGGTFSGDDQGDARISEQELINTHNAGYPPAIEAGVQSVMASFSSWNGEKLHGSHYLLTQALRDKMGFDGLVVGDWNGHGQLPGCTNDACASAINAGVDLIMVPTDWRAMYSNTLAQVKSGEVSVTRLNQAVRRILRVKVRGGLFKGAPSSRIKPAVARSVGSDEHRSVARQAVRESLVLLKNNQQTLPLNPKSRILVTGPGADNIPMQSGGWSVTWQGTGTTNKNFPGATSIYVGLSDAIQSAGGHAELSSDGSFKNQPDAAIVVFGETPYAEGHGDLNTLEFQPANKKALALIRQLTAQKIPVVSVFISGRPMWVNPEINASDAFVAAWLPGSEGNGIADVLLSDENGGVKHDFKGTLSFSWPAKPFQAEVNGPNYQSQPLFKLGYGLTYAQASELSTLPENLAGVASKAAGDIHFYQGRTIQPWNVFIKNHDRDQILSGAFASLPSGDVSIQTTDKDVQEDAMRFTWRDSWGAGLEVRNGHPLNLTPHLDNGVLSFDLNVTEFSKAVLNVELLCGNDCLRTVPMTKFAKAHVGKGWQRITMDLSCFMHKGDDFTAVLQPFNLNASGSGEVEVANVSFLLKGKANYQCPDYTKLSTTPAPQDAFWAAPWWGPRHHGVLEQIKSGDAELLMIGDSITQGWEKEGSPVWRQYYGNRKAVNMGFSGDRTEHVLWRIEHGELEGLNPKVAVLLIGTNNTGHRLEHPMFTVKGIEAILKELKSRLPNTKVLLLSVFPRDAKPDAPMRKINNQINQHIAHFADNKSVFYLNINSVFLTKDNVLETSIMPDLLHLNTKGYELWAEAMEPTLKRLLGE